MSNINYTLYTFEDKTSDEVLLINGFQHINQLIPYVNKIQQENQQLKEKINTYENPEDLTLMFMYCDEKAKDKIKQLKEELKATKEVVEEHLKKEIQLKEVIEEVREYIKEHSNNETEYLDVWEVKELLQILDKGESNE